MLNHVVQYTHGPMACKRRLRVSTKLAKRAKSDYRLGDSRSDSDLSRHYVGRTTNVDQRLEWHNTGPVRVHDPPSTVVSGRVAGISK